MLRVGVDIGGTFTDLVAIDSGSGQLLTAKVLTTSNAPGVAFKEGLQRILGQRKATMGEIDILVHGTTLATNALIERRGAKVALVTTAGFADVLEIARERRYDIYDILLEIPRPLVARRHCLEVAERVAADGQLITHVDPDSLVRDIGDMSRSEGIEAIAICFLHSYANPENERVARGALECSFPELFVSISSEVASEPGEYERASTAVANAYLQPLMMGYLKELTGELQQEGFAGTFYVMLSDGGLRTADFAARFPTHIIESGPAGGVQLSVSIGRALGKKRVLSFDMGGTTAKICLIKDFCPGTTNQAEVAHVRASQPGSGLPIKAPFIELVEVGTGGGSIARLNSLGLIAVGPSSAGASPGPACYGLGGTLPTVTDADLLLGYLRDDYLAAGEIRVDIDAARAAIDREIAEPLGLATEWAAWAIHNIANETMASAARLHAAQRGADITKFTLVASGGAGPVHAGELAHKLGIKEIVFPPVAGVASALGFLLSPVSCVAARAIPQDISFLDTARVNAAIEAMEREVVDEMRRAGVSIDQIKCRYTCMMGYVGQGSEIEVELPLRRLAPEATRLVVDAFESTYAEFYARLIPSLGVRISIWRVTAHGPTHEVPIAVPCSTTAAVGVPKWSSRLAYNSTRRVFREYRVYNRQHIQSGATFVGPAIVESPEATIIVPAEMTARTDYIGNLMLSPSSYR